MTQPRLLDLFCGAGGGAVGYARAGFDVVGVDIRAQPRYQYEFHQADALEFLAEHGHEFGVVHASPPCQRYSHGTVAGHSHKHPDLIGPTRRALLATERPYVIENVSRAPLHNPVTLCGSMFGLATVDDDGTPLRMERHRLFESNVLLYPPTPCDHDPDVRVAGSYGGARRDKDEARLVRRGGYVPSKAVQERLLGIDWMTEAGLYQAIPPAYTEWIGCQLFDHLAVAS